MVPPDRSSPNLSDPPGPDTTPSPPPAPRDRGKGAAAAPLDRPVPRESWEEDLQSARISVVENLGEIEIDTL